MENYSQNIEQDEEQEQIDNQQNYENGENGEENLEGIGSNYQEEYDGEMEGEEQIDVGQEGEEGQEEMEEGQEEQAYEGEEEAMEEGQEENMGEEAYVEQNEEVKEDNEQENENNLNDKNEEVNNNINENDKKEKFEDIEVNNKSQKNYNNKNSDSKNNLSNQKRIELIQNKLNLNEKKALNTKNHHKYNNNENIIDKDIDDENINIKNNNYKTFNNTRKNDILSELLSQIQDFKQKKQDINIKLNSNNNLDELDKDLLKGLEKLNNNHINLNNLKEEQKASNPQVESKILRNPKFKEIISLMNEKDVKKSKYHYNIGKNSLLNYKNRKKNDLFANINYFTPKINKYPSNTLEHNYCGNAFKKYGTDSNKFYISCIDGKAIVNGIRKDIPFVSKFNCKNDIMINNNTFNDLHKLNVTGKSYRRNNSFNINKFLKKNEFNYDEGNKNQTFNLNYRDKEDFNFEQLKKNFTKENITNNLNKMNDNYFTRELKFLK